MLTKVWKQAIRTKVLKNRLWIESGFYGFFIVLWNGSSTISVNILMYSD